MLLCHQAFTNSFGMQRIHVLSSTKQSAVHDLLFVDSDP